MDYKREQLVQHRAFSDFRFAGRDNRKGYVLNVTQFLKFCPSFSLLKSVASGSPYLFENPAI
jgi:hypothetical protein